MKYLIPLGLLLSGAVLAEGSAIEVTDAWVREAPPGAAMLAAYMKIHNTGAAERILTSVESTSFKHVMLHESTVIDGIAKMLHQDNLKIPAGGNLILQPGSFHLMMPAPDIDLQLGQYVEFSLQLKNGETIAVKAIVKRAGETGS